MADTKRPGRFWPGLVQTQSLLMLDLLGVPVALMRDMTDLLTRFMRHVPGGVLGAVDIFRQLLRRAGHDFLGEAAQGAGYAHVLADIVLHEIAQPFLLHAYQAGDAMTVLHPVQRLAVALKPEIDEAQAFVLREQAHFLNQRALAFGGVRQGFAELRYSLGRTAVAMTMLGLGVIHFGLLRVCALR